jgi:hypothetical protein
MTPAPKTDDEIRAEKQRWVRAVLAGGYGREDARLMRRLIALNALRARGWRGKESLLAAKDGDPQ